MSAKDNEALARKIYQLFDDDKLDDVLPMATDDVEIVLNAFGQTFRGREGFVDFMKGFKSAFPDLKINITNQVANEDQVVSEFVARGTHNGTLRTPAGDVPPTGRTVDFVVCEVWGIKGGKLASLHNYQDSAAILKQLGLMP